MRSEPHSSPVELSPLLLGISGGADSCYLLHHLAETFKGQLVVCHINHGLRGEQSDGDQDFVAMLAKSYGLPFHTKTIDLSGLTSSFEAQARGERLQFFKEVADIYGANHVALGHHRDDQAETILMNLCRGSAGVKGMDETTWLPDYQLYLWRPLLTLSKQDILMQMQSQGFLWREDATNAQPIATRNRVRNEVIPLLNEVFSRSVSLQIAKSYDQSLRDVLPELLEELRVLDPQGRLYVPRLQELSTVLQRNLLYQYLTKHQMRDLTQDKVLECMELLTQENVSKVNLPRGKYLRRRQKRLFIE